MDNDNVKGLLIFISIVAVFFVVAWNVVGS